MFDRELYAEVVEVTQEIAKERGIFWEEEQAEIAYTILTKYVPRMPGQRIWKVKGT